MTVAAKQAQATRAGSEYVPSRSNAELERASVERRWVVANETAAQHNPRGEEGEGQVGASPEGGKAINGLLPPALRKQDTGGGQGTTDAN